MFSFSLLDFTHVQLDTLEQFMSTSIHFKPIGHSMTWNSGRTIYSAISQVPPPEHPAPPSSSRHLGLTDGKLLPCKQWNLPQGLQTQSSEHYGLFTELRLGNWGGGDISSTLSRWPPTETCSQDSFNFSVILVIWTGRMEMVSDRFHCFHNKQKNVPTDLDTGSCFSTI